MKRLLLILILLQCFCSVALAQVDRYPNIQSPTTNSVIIAWTSASAYTGTVAWGTSSAVLAYNVYEPSPTKDHAVTITGLQPNTNYNYQVTGGSFTSNVENFYTAKPDSIKQLSFVVFGDCGFNSSEEDQIAARMAPLPVDFGLIMGDVDQIVGNDYDGNYFSHYKNTIAKKCYFTTIGNHDILTNNTNYTDAFHLPHNNPTNTELYYSFTWGNAKFIALDGNIAYTQGSAQYTWLENELKCNNSEWTFVYFHQPPWTNGWSVIYYIPAQPFFLYQGEDDMRTSLVPLFEHYHVDYVLNGHAHDYQSGVYHGVHYIISGGGGTPASDNIHTNSNSPNIQFEYHGDNYMQFWIDHNQVRYEAYDINGVILDSLTLNKTYTPYQSTFVIQDPKCVGQTNGRITVSSVGQNPPYAYNWSNGSGNNTAYPLAAGTYTVTVTDGFTCPRVETVTLTDPAPVVAVATVTNVTCFGSNNGQINLNTNGGTGPYTYVWNTGANTSGVTNLQPGQYNAVVRDSFACPDTVTATITQPQLLTDSISFTNSLCAGDSSGAVWLNIIGGTTPYTYLWNTGDTTSYVNQVAAGIYNVTITDINGCLKYDSATIASARLQLQANINNESCPNTGNGSVALSAAGGTMPYTYTWVNNVDANALTAGTYNVIATDANGCSIAQTYTITTMGGHDRPTLQGDVIICKGDSARISATPNFQTYNWNTGVTSAFIYAHNAGAYYLSAIDSIGCTVLSDTLNVTVDSVPHLQVTASTNALDVTVGASQHGLTNYQWDFGNGHTVSDTSSHINYAYPDSGIYTITLVTQYRCGNDTAYVTVHASDTLTGVLYMTEGTLQVKLQPNPMHVDAVLSLTHPANQSFEISLFTEDGKLLHDYGNIASNSIAIQRGNLAVGVYLLRISNETSKTILKMIVE